VCGALVSGMIVCTPVRLEPVRWWRSSVIVSALAITADQVGVLDPADLVTSGRVERAWLRPAPISYWLFVGHDVSQADLNAAVRR
jgi:hypothetical protein